MHGCERACCGQREPRRSAFSDGCGGFRQALGLAASSAHHLTITRMELDPARCEPIPAFPLPPEPSTCPAGLLRHPPLPGVSLFRCFRCYLDELSLAYAPVEHLSACGTPRCDQRRFHSPRRCSDEHFLVKPSTESLCWGSRVTTRATVGREESLSSSPQRPTCSRRRPYIPAAVPAQWFRLLISATLILLLSHAGGDYYPRQG